jgi:apolipoprotein D and lipocalin family protein
VALAVLLVLALAAASADAARRPRCPPTGFDSLPNFDIAAFVESGPWYALEQQEVFYQPKDQLFCVRAQYVPRDPKDLSKGIAVINTAAQGSVTGAPVGSSDTGAGFNGIVAFPDAAAAKKNPATGASKLRVLPSFLESAFKLKPSNPLISGPYWVVAAAPDLAWAVISGGPPNRPSNGKCRTGRAGVQTPLDINGSGFWIFAKNPAAGSEVLVPARAAAEALGYDLSVLLPVQQSGCQYPALA